MKKFLLSFVLTTIALLLTIMLFQWTKQLFMGATVTLDADYSKKIMIAGAAADGFRGLLLALLYPMVAKHIDSYKQAIWFGLLTSFMAGSLWVVYQYLAKDTLGIDFVIEETIIMILQGIVSGVVLKWVDMMVVGHDQ